MPLIAHSVVEFKPGDANNGIAAARSFPMANLPAARDTLAVTTIAHDPAHGSTHRPAPDE
jgi:hypothetical protein